MPLTEPVGVYRLFEEHFDRYVREYEERDEPRGAGCCPRSFRRLSRPTSPAAVWGAASRGAPARVLLPHPQLLPELPGEALGAVRGAGCYHARRIAEQIVRAPDAGPARPTGGMPMVLISGWIATAARRSE